MDNEPQYNAAQAYTGNPALRIIVAVVFLCGGLAFIGSSLVPPVYSVATEEILPANVEASWAALTDFAAYPQWNSYAPRIVGDFSVGEEITLTLVTGNPPAPRESHAVLTDITPLEQFAWEGGFPIPGIAHTRHVFALERVDDNHTRLRHFEEFRGLAVALDSSGRAQETHSNTQAFSRMNKALSQRLATTYQAEQPQLP